MYRLGLEVDCGPSGVGIKMGCDWWFPPHRISQEEPNGLKTWKHFSLPSEILFNDQYGSLLPYCILLGSRVSPLHTRIESISLNLHSRVKIEDESHGCRWAKFSSAKTRLSEAGGGGGGIALPRMWMWVCPFCLSVPIPPGQPGEHWWAKCKPEAGDE